MKNLFLTLITLLTFTFSASAKVFTVLWAPNPDSIVCNIGDTINFKSNTNAITVYISDGQNTIFTQSNVNNLNNIIVGNEKLFMMSYGTIHNQNTITVQPAVVTTIETLIHTDSKVILFPNPVGDILKVTTDKTNQLLIFNINGQLLIDKEVTFGTSDVDLTSISNGVYIVRIGNLTQRIIKQ